jgi:ribosomal protein S3AE
MKTGESLNNSTERIFPLRYISVEKGSFFNVLSNNEVDFRTSISVLIYWRWQKHQNL